MPEFRRHSSTGPSRIGAAARSARNRSRRARTSAAGASRPINTAGPSAPPGARLRKGRGRIRDFETRGAAGSSRRASRLTKQLVMLAAVFGIVALVLAFPLKNYLAAQADLRQQTATEQQLQDQLASLQSQKAALSDPEYVKAEARRRLQYVEPGDTVYVVQAPALTVPSAGPATPTTSAGAWYSDLWGALTDPGTGAPQSSDPANDPSEVPATSTEAPATPVPPTTAAPATPAPPS